MRDFSTINAKKTLSTLQGLFKRFLGQPAANQEVQTEQNTQTSIQTSDDWFEDGYAWVPDWDQILKGDWEHWNARVKAAIGGPKVLIATGVGGNSLLTPLETLYAVALTLRGAEVHFLICDKTLPACQNSVCTDMESQLDFLRNGPDKCDWCFETGFKTLSQLNLPVHLIGSLLTEEDKQEASKLVNNLNIEELMSLKIDGIDIEESVRSASLRYFGRGDFEGEPNARDIIERYTIAAIYSAKTFDRLWKNQKFEHMLVNQGCYVPQGISIEVAKKHATHITCWDMSYLKNCVTFSHEDTYLKTIFTEPVAQWQTMDWNSKMENEIDDYLKTRWSGEFDWMRLSTPSSDSDVLRDLKALGFNPDKPTIGLLTNVIWDAQLLYDANAFPNMLEWLLKSIDYFSQKPELQLLIRIHPAEKKCWLNSRQLALDEINKAFPDLKPNIVIIPAESPINTYEAMGLCDSVLIYATTAGLELSCLGIPVVVSGEGWIRNKGISYDVSSQEDYFKLLNSFPLQERLSKEQVTQAKKYAYHFFFRKSVPLSMLTPLPYENRCYEIRPVGIAGFEAGADLGLDIICDGILNADEFTYPHELVTSKQA